MQAAATFQRRLRQASFHTCTRVRASATQSDLWREHRFATVSGRYEITGPLREDALQRALQAVVARHPALRTTFTGEAGQLWQQVAHESRSPLVVTDLTRVPAADAGGELERRIAGMLAEPMDPAWGPLLRAVLFRTAGGYTLVLTGHRMILDDRSFEVLQRDIGLAYDDPAVPGEAFGFLDACRTAIPTPVAEAVAPPALPFRVRPTPAPAQREERAERLSLRLSPRAGLHLRDLARTHGTSPLPVFLAAFAATVGRYNEADEVLVGVAADGREGEAARAAIGPFAHVLSLRCPVHQPGGDFDDTIRRTVVAIAGAGTAHPGSPAPRVRCEMAAGERHPLRLAGCEVSGGRIPDPPGSGLELLISETAGRFEVTLTFDPDLIARERVQALLVQYLARLGGVEPATVRAREFAPPPQNPLVDRIGSVDPSFPALHCHTTDTTVTFGQLRLAAGAEMLAGSELFVRAFASWHVREHGIGPGDRCAVLAETAGIGQETLLRDILIPLSAGACVHLAPVSAYTEPARWLAGAGITVVHTTAAMLARITSARMPLPFVRLVILGDSLTTHAFSDGAVDDRAAAVFPHARIIGVYGCAAGPASVVELSAGHDRPEAPPLGDGTPFAQLLAVDSAGHPMPVNGVGEVAVRAPHLPAGHLPDPFGRPGVGLLLTGGRARVRPDLTLEFVSSL